MQQRQVKIIDATLREGMQSAGGTFSVEQSIEVALQLAGCGVATVECGHPGIGSEELYRVSAVVDALEGRIPVLGHARALEADVDAVAKSGAEWVGIFLGVNPLSMASRMPGCSRDDLFRRIEESVSCARERGLAVRFTVEDGSRTDLEVMLEANAIALAAGAARVCLSDTVGILEPTRIAEVVQSLRAAVGQADLEVHLHDDRGLAMANALAAMDAGANWISTSVNGLGERAGIVDLTTLLANLAYRDGRELPAGETMRDLSRRVGAYSRSAPDDRRPVVGANAFRHVAKLHVTAVGRDPETYEWIDPARFGVERVLGGNPLPPVPNEWIVNPPIISAEELRYHRAGPGDRFVLVDERFVPGSGQYCIARRIPRLDEYGAGHVDEHVHHCDSLFVFLGADDDYQGLRTEVSLDGEYFTVQSPASVFIPAGVRHSYRVVGGAGTYLNYVLAGDYNSSLLDPVGV
ncbi:2-isopropylmalate synthase [Nocardioides sp. Y6]|uniref:2-isopropylmalate synthase n=1 Tax=Nocardioides malaquae TaxID=2773426 RepID=A0ABR9RSU9_9ACTN|nr:2-isopropylmalate synthase [Nocardioides malaquae]MBE7324654.1 2-isopropylmalate synthase [Nocardioides malaquae]